jgi:hypothetical protein
MSRIVAGSSLKTEWVFSEDWQKGRAIADPASDEQSMKSPRVRYLKGCSKSYQAQSLSPPTIQNPARVRMKRSILQVRDSIFCGF